MKRLRFGAALHFLIAIGPVVCLFVLDEAFEAYGIRDIMHQIVAGQGWMLYALTIGFVLEAASSYFLRFRVTEEISPSL